MNTFWKTLDSTLASIVRVTLGTRRWAIGFAALLLVTASVQAGFVGDTNNPAGLGAAIVGAYDRGDRAITINPGTYIMPAMGGAPAVSLNNMTDLVLNAYDVTIIKDGTDSWNSSAFALVSCSNVTVAGACLTQSFPSTHQGRIVAKGVTGEGNNYFDWKIDAGYPVPTVGGTFAFNFVDASTRLLRVGLGDYYTSSVTDIGDNTFRADFGSYPLTWLVTNDFAVSRGQGSFKIHLVYSVNCTIKDMTMSRNGYGAIREEGKGVGGNRILNCVWTPGPKPEGATEEMLCSGAADGLKSTSANPGPDIRQCRFEGVILDDCIAVHGFYGTIPEATVTTNTVTVDGIGDLRAGEPVRINNINNYLIDATCTAINGNVLTLSTNLSVPAGSKISNPLANGPGYKIIGCRIGGTRSRGILTKGDYGLIQSNTISGCGMSGISCGPEFYWGESDYVYGTVIDGNLLEGNGLVNNGSPALLFHGEGATYGNRDTTIKNNTFVGNYSGDIIFYNGGIALISNNVMTGLTPWPSGFGVVPVISLGTADLVTLTNNLVYKSSVYSTLLAVGSGVTGLVGNNPSGIRAMGDLTWDGTTNNWSTAHWLPGNETGPTAVGAVATIMSSTILTLCF
jgi:hypothetical protein